MQKHVDLTDAVRHLGSFEHLFWLVNEHRPVHFTLAAEIVGKTTPADWRDALDRVQARHPLLSVRVDRMPGWLPRFRRVEEAPIPLKVVAGDPRSAWPAEVGEELATPFDPSSAPLARAVLIHAPDAATLIFAAHHAIADGFALAHVIRDTLEALAGAELDPLPVTPSVDEILGLSGPVARLEAAGGRQQPAAVSAKTSPYRPRDGARPKVQGVRLPQPLTARLRERAREERTTVHGALVAALAVACAHVSPDWRGIPLRLVSPVNVRRTLGVGEDCGVFLGAATSVLHPGVVDLSATGFWDLARHAKSSVLPAQGREGAEAVTSALRQAMRSGPDIATAAEFMLVAFARDALLRNLGELPFANRFGPLTLTAMWGPAVLSGFEGEQTISAATVNGSLCLTHTSYTPPRGLLETMDYMLAEAAAA